VIQILVIVKGSILPRFFWLKGLQVIPHIRTFENIIWQVKFIVGVDVQVRPLWRRKLSSAL
jgi:hypothetical protein